MMRAPVSRELAAALPRDPEAQLRVAHAIATAAFENQAMVLELEVQELREALADSTALQRSLEQRNTELEAEAQEQRQLAARATADQQQLASEKAALLETVKRLNNELSRQDHLRRNLLRQLQDDGGSGGGGSEGSLNASTERLVREVLASGRAQSKGNSDLQVQPPAAIMRALPTPSPAAKALTATAATAGVQAAAPETSTPARVDGPGALQACSPVRTGGGYKIPQQQGGAAGDSLGASYGPRRSSRDEPSGAGASPQAAGASPHKQQQGGRSVQWAPHVPPGAGGGSPCKQQYASSAAPAPPRAVDGKAFFQAARARLDYATFSSFLSAIKALNAGHASRAETLSDARALFGPHHSDLYLMFSDLLASNSGGA